MILRRAPWLLLLLVLFGLPNGPAAAVNRLGGDELEAVRAAMQEQAWARAIKLLKEIIQDDPEHLEARYLRGICYGEQGKHPTLENRLKKPLEKGGEDFEFILARDSLYRDVLYQYALLRRYAPDYPEAIRLGHAQIRLKPALAHAQVGLFKFYWRFIVDTNPDKARVWLEEQQTDHAAFFIGEVYQRKWFYRTADDIYAKMLKRPTTLSKTAMLIARARTHFAWNKPESATAFIEQAIAAIQSEADALFLFDEVKYIVSPAEVEAFHRIEDAVGYRLFFDTFWAKRNPMPAAPHNVRMAEHYRRLREAERAYLFNGFRAWYRNPFTHNTEAFPSTYALSSDFDDRGIIFIRHGEPDDYTVGEASSWLYEDSLLIFHFAPTCVKGICGVTKHFSPIPLGTSWGARLVGPDPLDAERKSNAYLMRGLTTDRHRWAERTKFMEIPHVVAAFRGQGRRTLVEVHYAMPLGTLSRALDKQADSVAVEVGMAVHDQAWQPVGFFRETKRLARQNDRAALAVDRFQMDVPPDSYHVALHVRSLQTPRLGAYTFDYRPPRFTGPGLKMSDLLLADAVIELEATQPPGRDDLYVQVNPAGRFRARQPVFVYFEIYDLTPSPEGRMRYHVTYTLTPKQPGGLRGLVRRGEDGAISLAATEQESPIASPVEYVAIDVADVPPGAYFLTVTIRDEWTGAVVERSRALELFED